MRGGRTLLAIPILIVMVTPLPACIELQWLLTGQKPGSDGDGADNDNASNGNDNENGNGNGLVPQVRLSVSNPAPQLSEEVRLTCEIVVGDAAGAAFAFQPPSGQLVVNAATGIASFFVSEADIGISFSFTCTAANQYGTSPPSNSAFFIPTAPPTP